jgi:hypothetical protein
MFLHVHICGSIYGGLDSLFRVVTELIRREKIGNMLDFPRQVGLEILKRREAYF